MKLIQRFPFAHVPVRGLDSHVHNLFIELHSFTLVTLFIIRNDRLSFEPFALADSAVQRALDFLVLETLKPPLMGRHSPGAEGGR
jgi:hypothetical protein